VPIDIFGGDTLTEEFAALNPDLTTPVLELEDGEHLPESNAILLHLAEGTDLMPGDELARAQVYRWLFFEQARIVQVIGGLRFRLLTGRLSPDSEGAQRQRKIGVGLTTILARHLEERDYFVGNRFTVADVGIYGYMHVAGDAGIEVDRHPRLAAWLERVRERPGHVADLEGFPENARLGKSKSIYDLLGV
jgi:glutathione S-transferase